MNFLVNRPNSAAVCSATTTIPQYYCFHSVKDDFEMGTVNVGRPIYVTCGDNKLLKIVLFRSVPSPSQLTDKRLFFYHSVAFGDTMNVRGLLCQTNSVMGRMADVRVAYLVFGFLFGRPFLRRSDAGLEIAFPRQLDDPRRWHYYIAVFT